MKFEETAKRLRQAMESKGLRQQDLADQSGVSKSNIRHYVNGNHIPDSFMAYKLAQVLEVKPEWLMGTDAEDAPDYMVIERTELTEMLDKMNKDMLDRLTLYAKELLEDKNE